MGLLIILALFPVAWFLQNLVHEGSHLLVGWLVEGRKPTKIIPWPSKRNGKLYFAYYENSAASKQGSPMYRHIAPLIASWLLMSIFLTLLLVTHNMIFLPFLVCPVVDYCVWVLGYVRKSPRTDGKAFLDVINRPIE